MVKLVKPEVKLLSITEDAEKVIERAGRTCYKSEEKITDSSAREFISMIIKRGHESVLEHATASFHIVCDRGVTHELVRHRLASYSQESTRYCNYGSDKFGKEITVVDWGDFAEDQPAHNSWLHSMVMASRGYFDLIDRGYAPQIARQCLPINVKTEIVVTANFREWRHILQLRTDTKAHPHIRAVMYPVLTTLQTKYPSCFKDLV